MCFELKAYLYYYFFLKQATKNKFHFIREFYIQCRMVTNFSTGSVEKDGNETGRVIYVYFFFT